MALTEVRGGVGELLYLADALNAELESRNGRTERSGRGQFATPSQAARTMASLLEPAAGELRVVDPGAGAGALMLALVAAAVERGGLKRLSVDLVETDQQALRLLETAVQAAHVVAEANGLRVATRIVDHDFCDASSWTRGRSFDAAILNPPYMKLGASDPDTAMVVPERSLRARQALHGQGGEAPSRGLCLCPGRRVRPRGLREPCERRPPRPWPAREVRSGGARELSQ